MNRMRMAERLCRTLAIVSVVLVMLMQAGTHNGIALRVAAGLALLAITADAVLSWQLGKQAAAAQESAPKQTVLATVVSRRTTHRWIMHGGRAVSSSGRDAWFVSFRTARGDVLEFETPYDVYEHLREGRHGRLRYQGWQFIAFKEEPNSFCRKGATP